MKQNTWEKNLTSNFPTCRFFFYVFIIFWEFLRIFWHKMLQLNLICWLFETLLFLHLYTCFALFCTHASKGFPHYCHATQGKKIFIRRFFLHIMWVTIIQRYQWQFICMRFEYVCECFAIVWFEKWHSSFLISSNKTPNNSREYPRISENIREWENFRGGPLVLVGSK